MVKENKRAAYRNLGSRLWGSILMIKQSGLLGCTSQIKPRTQHSTDILPPQTTTYREKREIILLFLLNFEIPFIFIFTLEPWFLIWKVHQTVLGICKKKKEEKWESSELWKPYSLPSYNERSKLYSKLRLTNNINTN